MSRTSKGATALLVICALLPVCLAGWLVWGSLRHGAPAHRQAGTAHPGAAAPHTPDGKASPAPTTLPLAGKTVVLDPGHNLDNQYHTAEINRLVDVGNGRKECDTTGTSTDAGYAEATFTLDVARRARALLTALGATVKLTYDGDRPFGPCVDERARVGNDAHADAAVSVHADGSAPGNRGFHVILPAPVHQGIADNTAITGPSRRLGLALRAHFASVTGTGFADYLGGGTGLTVRDDLGGLNLSTVPKVFIECGNMRNGQDAALMTDAGWRQRAAQGISDGITAYLEGKD